MRKTFFLIFAFFAVLGVSAQENILVEYFQYNQDSAIYELKKTILREYDKGVEPNLEYANIDHHPLAPHLFQGSNPIDGILFINENAKKITEEDYASSIHYFHDFFDVGDSKVRRTSTNIRHKFNEGVLEISYGRFLLDSIIYLLENDKINYFNNYSYDKSQELCEFGYAYNYEDDNWEVVWEYVECDSIVKGEAFGHHYNKVNRDSSLTKKVFNNQNWLIKEENKYWGKEDIYYDSISIDYYYTTDVITSKDSVRITVKGFRNDTLEFGSVNTQPNSINPEVCNNSICAEFDKNHNLKSYESIGGFGSWRRVFIDNYSIGYKIDRTTGLEIITDSMVMHRDYLAASNNKLINKNVASVFPNPSTGTFTIQVENNSLFNTELFDMQGRVIRKDEGIGELQLSNLEKGSYIIKVISSQGVSTQRIEVVE